MNKRFKLLAVLAHPDDESLGFGGTLARYAADYNCARNQARYVSEPFATGMARRALEIAGEVAAGRLRAADVSRKP